METVSQRLEETTARLGDVAEGLRTNIAVHEERLKNQDKLIEEVRQAAKEHQQSDLAAHALMNEKLDKIDSKLDVMQGAASVKQEAPKSEPITDAPSILDKLSAAIDKWKYWFYGGIFVAGIFAHRLADVIDYIEKLVTGHS